jgi:hypothetical protein
MAKVRVEWVRLAHSDFERGGGGGAGLAVLAGAQVVVASSTPVATSTAPAFSADAEGQDGFARVTGLAGAVNIAWGAAPVASETGGVRVQAGDQVLIAVSTGQSLSIIEAADAPAAPPVQTSPLQAEATSRSNTIIAGGTAQDLMPANPVRRGWRVQNQSSGELYVASKGVAGTTLASLTQSSFKIAPGVIWTEDGHITANALSIIGATTGQAFYAREW